MAVGFSNTNKPINPRGNDASPKGYNRASLYSGKALDFDGVNDNVQCDNVDTLSTSDFTISYFFKYDSANATYGVNQGTGGTNQAIITGKKSNGKITFAFYSNDLDASADLTPAQNEYFLLSFTYNRTTKERKIYINGVLSAEDVSAANPNPTSGNLFVGQFLSTYMDGKIANVKIFNTALTAAQVDDLYNNPEKVVPTGVDNTALKLWLPMQEGAGTTAYDGSGNGNHGTISGATYVHGIGAPVSQTAVIDWNKGTNYVANSLEIINANFTDNQVSSVSGFEAPDGTLTASKITSLGASSYLAFNTVANNHKRAIYAKTTSGTGQMHLLTHNSNTNNLFTITEEWQKFSVDSVTSTIGETSFYLVDFRGSSTLSEILIWAPNSSTTNYNIVPTLSTAQTSEVLLPQGLTTGRDITGVNLFENVRKQGALNLDGNSWAEVHDNASLDVTSGVSLESWIYIEDNATQGRILTKWGSTQPNRSFQMFMNNAVVRFLIGDGSSQNGLNSATSLTEGNWHHIVGTYDGANIKIYIDGSEDVTTAETFTIYNSNEPLYIGGYTNNTNLSVNPIAQPRIYNRALTAEEVLQNYNSGKNTYK